MTFGEEDQRADERDDREDPLGREHRVHVGVRRAEGLAAVGEDQAVPVEPVGRGLEQDEHAEQHRQVSPGGPGGVHPAGRGDPEPAVQVVHDRRRDDRQDHGREQEVQQHPQERHREHEERQVEAELRVLLVEGRAVHELQPGLPQPRRGRAREQGEDAHADQEDQPPVRVERDPVAVGALRRPEHPRPEHRAGAVREHHVAAHDGDHQGGAHDEQHHLGDQHRGEHRGETHRVIPEVVGVDPREDQQ